MNETWGERSATFVTRGKLLPTTLWLSKPSSSSAARLFLFSSSLSFFCLYAFAWLNLSSSKVRMIDTSSSESPERLADTPAPFKISLVIFRNLFLSAAGKISMSLKPSIAFKSRWIYSHLSASFHPSEDDLFFCLQQQQISNICRHSTQCSFSSILCPLDP